MSKTTAGLTYDPIVRYLNQLAINKDWLDMWPQNNPEKSKRSVACVDDNGGITIYGASHGWKATRVVPIIHVCIKLMPHKKQPVFLIEIIIKNKIEKMSRKLSMMRRTIRRRLFFITVGCRIFECFDFFCYSCIIDGGFAVEFRWYKATIRVETGHRYITRK